MRPSQRDVIEIATQQLAAGERELHIVAPPGSGKTVLGLYLWACCIKQPCLVLSPNSAIQAQWAARIDLFESEVSRHELVSTNTDAPRFLTSLTYQSVTLPSRENKNIERQAIELWCDKLIETGEAMDCQEAMVWLDDLRTHNPDYFESKLGNHCKKIRDEISISGESLSLLHTSSVETLKLIGAQNIGVLILDECHHLVGHWGRVLADAIELLGDPVVLGLTATPPDLDGKDERDVERYESFFGPIDFEVPVPAVVKDGYLAPYQDLAYFVRPSANELKFVASADQELDELVENLSNPDFFAPSRNVSDANTTETIELDTSASSPEAMNLVAWLTSILADRRLPTGEVSSWRDFAKRDLTLSVAARQFLRSRNKPLPTND